MAARGKAFPALPTFTAQYGITGCGIFKAGIQNWKGFCIKINCSQTKLLTFENWTNGEPHLHKSEFLNLIIYIFHVNKMNNWCVLDVRVITCNF